MLEQDPDLPSNWLSRLQAVLQSFRQSMQLGGCVRHISISPAPLIACFNRGRQCGQTLLLLKGQQGDVPRHAICPFLHVVITDLLIWS